MSVREHLSPLDLWVVALYLVGITVLGLYVSRRVRDSSSFFIGGRRFGKLLMLGQTLSSGTHADQATGVMGACYEIGLAGIWYQRMWLFTTPLWRRYRIDLTGLVLAGLLVMFLMFVLVVISWAL